MFGNLVTVSRLDSRTGDLQELAFTSEISTPGAQQAIVNIIEDIHIDFFKLFWFDPSEALASMYWAMFPIFFDKLHEAEIEFPCFFSSAQIALGL